MPAAPILVLLPAPLAPLEATGAAPGRDSERMILGLGLIRRAVLAARRAGYGQVFVLSANGDPAADVPGWSQFAASLAFSPAAPLVITPAAILAETDWLERLAKARIEPAAWAAIPNRIVMVAAASTSSALAALEENGGARDLIAVESGLARRFGSPAQIPAGIDPIVVATPADVRLAERRLMRALVKDTDGFMARHVERPISLQISRLLAPTAITPNQMSLISIVVGICGAPFFLSQRASFQTIGALLFLAHSILDGCDGELARLKFAESRWGGVLDFWGDNVVHVVVFACMGVGWSLAAGAGWPLLLGAAAVFGTLGSAGFVYWRLMRGKDDSGALYTSVSAEPERPLARVLDAASRRDFIYLVILLALFGKSNWFLLLAALGAPIYFCLVLFLAARERFVETRSSSGA
jgi:phosphatidylglycerophosphate synthase